MPYTSEHRERYKLFKKDQQIKLLQEVMKRDVCDEDDDIESDPDQVYLNKEIEKHRQRNQYTGA